MNSEEIIVISQNDQSKTPDENSNFVLFIIIGILVGTCLRYLNKILKIPHVPMLLLFGLLIGYFSSNLLSVTSSTTPITYLDPRTILLVFIPVLTFESAFNCQWYLFRKLMINILVLGIAGVIWGAILMAVCFKVLLFYGEGQLSWWEALTLGCILSITDHRGIIGLLKQLGAHVRFNTLIEGQSLVNDGIAMLFFTIFLDLSKNSDRNFTLVVINIIRASVGGPILGVIFGVMVSIWIKKIIRDNILLVSITVVTSYLCFYLAQFTFLKVSGILSIVSFGLYMSVVGKRKVYPESENALHEIWSFIQYNCQTLIFIISGVIVGTLMLNESTITIWDWFRMLIFWFLMIGVRAIMILTFYPIIKKTGYGITKKQLVVLIYGGLRGALGMCLALIVSIDKNLPERFRQLTVFYMCGMVMLTILINGLTCKKIINYIQMIPSSQIKQKLLKKCSKQIIKTTKQKLQQLKIEPIVAYAQWKDVEKLVNIRNFGLVTNQIEVKKQVGDSLKQINSNEIVDEIRYRFIRYLHKVYWEMFKHGQISQTSIAILSQCCDIINDENYNRYNYFELLSSNFLMETNKYYIKLKNIPIIGPLCTRLLINKIYDAYEMTATFIQACQQAIHVFEHSFPLHNQNLNSVIDQVKQNIQQATNYVLQLQNNYPTIIKAVQTSKASTMILKHKRLKLSQMYNQGFIDSNDYDTLQKQIDIDISQIQNHDFQLSDIKFTQVLTISPLFINLPTHEIVNIRMKSNQRIFSKGTTIQLKDKQIRYIYFIITGSIKQQFENFYMMKSIGNVVNPYDFIYKEVSKATIKTMTNSKVMQIQGKVIMELLQKYIEFKKKWYKSIIGYSIKLSKASSIIGQHLNQRQLRKFIDGTIVVFLAAGDKTTAQFGAYIFEGQVYCINEEREILTRDSFFFQNKTIVAKTNAKIVLFRPVGGTQVENRGVVAINDGDQN